MFYYKIYGKSVAVNIELPLLTENYDFCSDKIDLEINVEFGEIKGDNIKIEEFDDNYKISLGSFSIYRIFPAQSKIMCVAKNFEAFFSTLFNIPFSVYFLHEGEFLYHACGLEYNNFAFCLTGNKGVGKSTITQILSLDNTFRIFADDTIYIDKNFCAYNAHNLLKQTASTTEILQLNTLNKKNAAGKYYLSFEKVFNSLEVSKIFHIIRTSDTQLNLKPVKSDLKKSSIFKTNIVGINYMPCSLMSKTLKFKAEKSIEFYDLYVPNDLNLLIKEKDKLKDIIIKSF